MDIAVNLVENYLRLSGYLTLSEFEIQQRTDRGTWETLTDIDIVAIRFPDDAAPCEPTDPECRFLMIDDAALELEPDTIDLIIGEVKQGEAELNAGMQSPAALRTILERFGWLYEADLEAVIGRLREDGISRDSARSGGRIRTRLVAFGRSATLDVNTISLTHVFEAMDGYLRDNQAMLQGAQFKEPAPALLHLLVKTGFEVEKDGD